MWTLTLISYILLFLVFNEILRFCIKTVTYGVTNWNRDAINFRIVIVSHSTESGSLVHWVHANHPATTYTIPILFYPHSQQLRSSLYDYPNMGINL